MIRKAVYIIVVIIFILFIRACKTNDDYKVIFSTESYNLDTVSLNSKMDVVFKFRNNSKDTIRIINVASGCDCGKIFYNTNINPFIEDSIVVRYNFKYQGYFRRSVSVYTTSNNYPIKLTVEGYVKE